MRKRNKKSPRNRQHGNGAFGRRALNIEQLEARRMMAGDAADSAGEAQTAGERVFESYLHGWLDQEDVNAMSDHTTYRFAQFTNVHGGKEYSQIDKDVFDAADQEGLLGGQEGLAKTFIAKQRIEEMFTERKDAAKEGTSEGDRVNNTAIEIANRMAAQNDDNSPGWHTGFLGLPYYNLETTTPDGDNEGGITWAWEDGDGESGHGAIDEDDKLIWAWDDEEENEGSDGDDGNGEGQKDDKSKGDAASDDDSSRDEDDDDGITWFWEDDDEDDDDEDEGDSQSRQTEESRDSDPRRGGNGPDPRQGGLGRPGAGNNSDPAPYRGVIVQGGNSDPSDPESAPKGPGAAPDHPTYGAIDYGPDGKPVSHQGYLPPKDLLVQGGDIDPPKNREHQAVDALFSQIGNEHAGSATNAAATVASTSVDLGGNLPTFRRRK